MNEGKLSQAAKDSRRETTHTALGPSYIDGNEVWEAHKDGHKNENYTSQTRNANEEHTMMKIKKLHITLSIMSIKTHNYNSTFHWSIIRFTICRETFETKQKFKNKIQRDS